jgi:hypothetical protein
MASRHIPLASRADQLLGLICELQDLHDAEMIGARSTAEVERRYDVAFNARKRLERLYR